MEKILIIEDNEMMRLFLASYFSKNYEVTTAETPAQANKIIEDGADFALIMADYQPKETTARAEFNLFHLKMKARNIPVVILTDNDKSDQRIDSLSLGIEDCLSKPFNPIELSMRVEQLAIKDNYRIQYRTVA
jgi:DNA-binding response OmpR family regulator